MPTTFSGLVDLVIELIAMLIPLLITVTFVVVVWKVINAWVFNADDPNARREGQSTVIIGVVAVVCMLIIWGILAMLQNTLF